MVAAHDRHPASAPPGRDAEWVALALNNEHWHFHGSELRTPILSAAQRTQWEGETEHGEDVRRSSRPARDPSARGTTTRDERQTDKRTYSQCTDDSEPRLVELRRTRRRPAARDPVWLLHERDCKPLLLRHRRNGSQIRRIDPAARTVTKNERSLGSARYPHVRARKPLQRLNLHTRSLALPRRSANGGKEKSHALGDRGSHEKSQKSSRTADRRRLQLSHAPVFADLASKRQTEIRGSMRALSSHDGAATSAQFRSCRIRSRREPRAGQRWEGSSWRWAHRSEGSRPSGTRPEMAGGHVRLAEQRHFHSFEFVLGEYGRVVLVGDRDAVEPLRALVEDEHNLIELPAEHG